LDNDDGITHPRNWAIWSDEDKVAVGLVWADDPAPFDNRFYWSAGVPKSLDDVNEVDEDGNPVLDMNGVQIVTKGLKSNAIAQVKATAGGLLQPTDWMVTRKAEAGTEIPSSVSWITERLSELRQRLLKLPSRCYYVRRFMALYDAPVDADGMPTGNAPINDWPDTI
jgi:hypothetical protein